MTFNDLQIVNSEMSLTPIKSKKGNKAEYAKVDEKIKAFRMLYPSGGINTAIISLTETTCVAHAEITDDTGRILCTGTAQKDKEGNTDQYIESAETAAVGRALRFLGIGVEAIKNARPVLDETARLLELGELRGKIYAYILKHKFDEEKIKKVCERYKVDDIMDMDLDCCRHYIYFITKNGGDINE